MILQRVIAIELGILGHRRRPPRRAGRLLAGPREDALPQRFLPPDLQVSDVEALADVLAAATA
jgi:hypothetical protein